MKNIINKRALLACVGLVAASLSGCGTDEVTCVVGKKQPESCNLYVAKGTEAAPMDNSVVIVGDSLWDYGKPHGAIPLKLVEFSSKTYYELARSGAHTDYILEKEIPIITSEGSGLAPKTVLVNGAANNVRTPCKSDPVNNINMTSFTPGCHEAIDTAIADVSKIITALNNISTVEHIIWVGPQRFPDTVVSDALIDYVFGRLNSACTPSLKCHYVDLRDLWSSGVAATYLFDNEHVNQAGADLVGARIWNVMESVGAYR